MSRLVRCFRAAISHNQPNSLRKRMMAFKMRAAKLFSWCICTSSTSVEIFPQSVGGQMETTSSALDPTTHPEDDADWSYEAFKDLVGDLSEWTSDILDALNCVITNFDGDILHAPTEISIDDFTVEDLAYDHTEVEDVGIDLSLDAPQALVLSAVWDDVPQCPVSERPDVRDDIPQYPICEISDVRVDIPQCPVSERPDVRVDVPQYPICEIPDVRVDIPQCPVSERPDVRVDIPQCPVSERPDERVDIPQCPVSERPDVRVDIPQYPICEIPDVRVDIPQCPVSERPDERVDIPQCPVSERPDVRVDIPQYPICEISDVRVDMPQCPVSERPDVRVDLPQYLISEMSNVRVDIPQYPVSERPDYRVDIPENLISEMSDVRVDIPQYPVSERPDFWVDIPENLISEMSDVRIDIPEYLISEMSNVRVDIPQYPVSERPDFWVDIPENLISEMSDVRVDIPQYPVSERPDFWVDIPENLISEMSDVRVDIPQYPVSERPDFWVDIPENLISEMSDVRIDIPEYLISEMSNVRVDIPQYPVSERPDFWVDIPENLISEMSDVRIDIPEYLISEMSNVRVDIPQYPVSERPDFWVDIPENLISEMSDVRIDIPEYLISEMSNVRVDIPQYPVSERPDFWVDIPENLISEMSDVRIDIPEYLISEMSNVRVDIPQYPVSERLGFWVDIPENLISEMSDVRIDNPEYLISEMSNVRVDIPQYPVSERPDFEVDIPESLISEISHVRVDIPQYSICEISDVGVDVPQCPVSERSDVGVDVPQCPVSERSDVGVDVPQCPVSERSDVGVDVPQCPVSERSDVGVDVPQCPVSERSDVGVDVPQCPVSERSDVGVNVPQCPVSDRPDVRVDAPQYPISEIADLQADVPQYSISEKSDVGIDLPQYDVCELPDISFDVSQQSVQLTSPPVSAVSECCDAPQDPDTEKSDCDDEDGLSVISDVSHSFDSSTEESLSSQSYQLNDDDEIIDINSCRYEIGMLLGEGGYGSVYEGIRLTDGLKVALKFTEKTDIKYIDVEGYSEAVPIEIGLLILANKGPRVPQIIHLLDWHEEADRYIMVLERPMPCEDLFDFLVERHEGTIKEDVAEVIMRQTTLAAQTCCQRGVLHSDIKLENLLINPDTHEIKLIDFGCGEVLTTSPYTSFSGTRDYCPPEYHITGKYHGEAATSWSIGVLLYVLLCGEFPESEVLDELNETNWTKDSLSKECCELLCSLLQKDPKKRLELAKVLLHKWFKGFKSQQEEPEIIDVNSCRYEIGKLLGEGGYGRVYEGIRLTDGLKVALKFLKKTCMKYIVVEGCSEAVPMEIGLLILANKGPRVPQIIHLLDWHEDADRYIMVLERPMPCEDLFDFLIERHEGTIKEDVAEVIMQQTTLAAQTCCQRGVLHSDIKLENLLINPDTHEIKLIDFGYGEVLTASPYTSFSGTQEYCPPEYHITGEYHGEAATSWSLGILLYVLLCGDFPEPEVLDELNESYWRKDGLSEECCELLCSLLQRDPEKRLELAKVLLHKWFKVFKSQQEEPEIIDVNSCRYEIGKLLGEGGYGSVYEGIRLTDGLKVALKFSKKTCMKYIDVEGFSEAVPIEIGLLILANKGPRVPQIIHLLDWHEEADRYIMVLERPMPCEDLFDFLIERHEGTIKEDVAEVIMQQTTLAAQTCCQRGVLHSDIKLENLLINPDTHEIKLIDFGCGEVLTASPYTSFSGTRAYCPPEYHITGEYHGEAATSWSLGILLYVLLCGDFPEPEVLDELNESYWRKDGLSEECCELLCSLLQRDPEKRLELAKVLLHKWFKGSKSQQEEPEIIDVNSCRYEIGKLLGEGGYGSVYEGIRLTDGLKVALKFSKKTCMKYIDVEGFSEAVPIEIGLLILANKGPRVPQIIHLLDWHEEADCYIMVLERPMPCEDLFDFLIERHEGTIKEDVAEVIMQQTTLAAQTCCQRGVLHSDIKLENLLINPDTHEIKLIDFGCGEVLTTSPYTSFSGTRAYCPPEYHITGEYHGEAATSWSLGILLYVLLCGDFPEPEVLDELNESYWRKDGLSEECCELLCSLLQRDPEKRLELAKVLLHKWFKGSKSQQEEPEIIDVNSCRYEIGKLLGEGGYGSVYEGIRLTDGLKVALKFSKKTCMKYIDVEGFSEAVPIEIGLLILANKGPRVPQIIHLLDWHEEADRYIMVLERPMPCEDLFDFLIERHEGTIKEDVAEVIMQQTTLAAQTCCQRGVLHSDIKLENLLINPDTHEVKLIDFGCGEVLTQSPYTSFSGTRAYCPPEYHITGEYHGEAATSWSLGILLYVLLCGDFPEPEVLDELNESYWRKDGLSEECCELLCSLLQRDPEKRLELAKVLLHKWFKGSKSQQEEPEIIDVNSCRYEIGKLLGEGGYGSVYEGIRLTDGLKVALKFSKKTCMKYIDVEGFSEAVPIEIGLLILANKGPRVPQIIHLLDWHEEADRYIMVLERPMPCEDLFDFLIERHEGTIKEDVAEVIMQQTTLAAQTCCQRGVLHSDIKLENLLINPDTHEIKLIDFGCGEVLTTSPYTSFSGTRAYCPPEYHITGEYHGEAATSWSLGILLYVLLCGDFPEPEVLDELNESYWRKDGLSEECCELLCSLLQRDPEKRLELAKVLLHKWFKGSKSQQEEPEIIDVNSCRYEIGKLLGEGGYGSVYEGIRLTDGLKVALKFSKKTCMKYIDVEGFSEAVPIEIGLLILANKGPRVPQIIHLLDWHEEADRYIMVLERPMPCEDLFDFLIERHEGTIKEDVAEVIMQQTTLAAQTCCQRGVLHSDIKLENLLINPDTHEIKLIDFGCGEVLTTSPYTSFSGTRAYCPPEYHITGEYHGEAATSWSLGILLYVLLCGDFPEPEVLDELNESYWRKDGLSEECCELLCSLLQRDPEKRLELAKVLLHKWFKGSKSQQEEPEIIDVNSCRYEIGKLLGEGGYGSVYEGIRLTDGLKVALKFSKKTCMKYIDVEGFSEAVPIEIGLLILANKGPRVPQIIHLLDWHEEADRYIMVLERPMPCEDLFDFLIERHEGTIKEDVAEVIMQQTTLAAQTCCQRGVLHSDIKLENLLINPDTHEIKLIDFGCGEVLTASPYTSFSGTREYCPPEYHITGEYHGEAATTWSLGILLYVLLCGDFPEPEVLDKLNESNWRKDGLSEDCCKLLCSLLQRDPAQRLDLEKISLHTWFKNFIH